MTRVATDLKKRKICDIINDIIKQIKKRGMKMRYGIGLDIGIESVGYAVLDNTDGYAWSCYRYGAKAQIGKKSIFGISKLVGLEFSIYFE